MNKLLTVPAIVFICALMTAGCKSVSCPQHYKDPNPYIMYFNKETIIGDTLYLSITIYNQSDSPNLVYINPHIIPDVVGDSSLRPSWHSGFPDQDHLLPKLDAKGKSMLNCKNCTQHYSESTWYKTLKKGESYTCYKRFAIAGLKKKTEGYSFMLKLSWNIPSYLSAHCPAIWTGNTYAIGKVVK